MRLIATITTAVLMMLMMSSAATAQRAQGAGSADPPVIAVVDMRAVLQDSAAGRSITEQFEARRKQFREEIAKEESELRDARKELNRQRSILSPEAMGEREKQFEERVTALQRGIQGRKKELEDLMVNARKELGDHVKSVMEKMVEERGIDLIIAKQQLIYTAPDLEITEDVLKRLNKRISRIELEKPDK